MLSFLLWYLLVTLLGLLTFPLAYVLLPALSGRGYALSRALGLLLWAFSFWLLASFGILANNAAGLLFALALLAGLGGWAFLRHPLAHWEAWFSRHRGYVLAVEVLFLAAFAAMAFIRANNPENVGTEKPMEMAFINAILRSENFPPHDPWLSGYAISYYYFGYVMAAMLAKLTFTGGGSAFNLMLALVFALSAAGAYGLLYDLLAPVSRRKPILAALLAPLFLLVMSNVEGLLEYLHSHGWGWQPASNPGFWASLGSLARPNLQAYNFWTWLDIKDLNLPPALPLGWNPRFWFWWRASRVVQDYDLLGSPVEVIDEFPFFSYLLGDLHPHVLAMPFGLLAMALALHVYLGGWRGEWNLRWFKIPLQARGLGLLAVTLGGLAFLNTWDFPVALALAGGALVLAGVQRQGWRWQALEEFLSLALPLGGLSVVLYLPFYVGFASQAGGILPNVTFPSRGAHLWVMFGTLFVPLFLFLGWLARTTSPRWKWGVGLTLGGISVLAIFSLVLGLLAALTPEGQVFVSSQGLVSTGDVFAEAWARRLAFSGSLLTLGALIGLALALLTATQPTAEIDSSAEVSQPPNPLPFVLMFILFGGLLALAPEFVYLRDQFGTRMNTIFKFYYQTWALWAVAAAFGGVTLWRGLRGFSRLLVSALLALSTLAGLVYPALALPNRANDFLWQTPEQRTLDGSAYLREYYPDDYDAILWLRTAPWGVVAEAVGGSYTGYARVSTYSGLPTVLGWPGHEGQWRGTYDLQGTRMQDVQLLYETASWEEARAVLERYGITYVFVGSLERSTYRVNEEKFEPYLDVVHQQGAVTIYAAP